MNCTVNVAKAKARISCAVSAHDLCLCFYLGRSPVFLRHSSFDINTQVLEPFPLLCDMYYTGDRIIGCSCILNFIGLYCGCFIFILLHQFIFPDCRNKKDNFHNFCAMVFNWFAAV